MTSPLPVVLATGNPGKTREFGRLLGEALDVRPIPESIALPEETESTFAANARLKASAVFQALGGEIAVLADDSGLEVTSLDGRPGVLSARFAGDGARDEDNVRKLLDELADKPDRGARFVCCLCLAVPGGGSTRGRVGAGRGDGGYRMIEVAGFTCGRITEAPRGSDGFGYDPVFRPDGWELTLAEAAPEDKDRVSHRGAASRALLQRLTTEEG